MFINGINRKKTINADVKPVSITLTKKILLRNPENENASYPETVKIR